MSTYSQNNLILHNIRSALKFKTTEIDTLKIEYDNNKQKLQEFEINYSNLEGDFKKIKNLFESEKKFTKEL